MQVTINRQLLGVEDIAWGVGTEEQIRGGISVAITRINAAEIPYDGLQTLGEVVDPINSLIIPNIDVILASADSALAAAASALAAATSETNASASALAAEVWSQATQDMAQVKVYVKALEPITKGQPVKFTSYDAVNAAIEVNLANQATSFSIGLAHETMATDAFGTVVTNGILTGIDTSAYTNGQVLYVDGTGILTATEPTTGTLQPIAMVTYSHATEGRVMIVVGYPKQKSDDIRVTSTGGVVTAGLLQTALQAIDDLKVTKGGVGSGYYTEEWLASGTSWTIPAGVQRFKVEV